MKPTPHTARCTFGNEIDPSGRVPEVYKAHPRAGKLTRVCSRVTWTPCRVRNRYARGAGSRPHSAARRALTGDLLDSRAAGNPSGSSTCSAPALSGESRLLAHIAPLSNDRLTVINLGNECTILPSYRARMLSDASMGSVWRSRRTNEERKRKC